MFSVVYVCEDSVCFAQKCNSLIFFFQSIFFLIYGDKSAIVQSFGMCSVCQISALSLLMSSMDIPLVLISSASVLSIPGDIPFLSAVMVSYHFLLS